MVWWGHTKTAAQPHLIVEARLKGAEKRAKTTPSIVKFMRELAIT